MKTTITIDKKTYEKLIKKKMKASFKMGRPLTWDEFFDRKLK